MKEIENKVFLLALKKSKDNEETYCVGVFKLNADTEFIKGVLYDGAYKVGQEVEYIYHANYSTDLEECLNWLNKKR